MNYNIIPVDKKEDTNIKRRNVKLHEVSNMTSRELEKYFLKIYFSNSIVVANLNHQNMKFYVIQEERTNEIFLEDKLEKFADCFPKAKKSIIQIPLNEIIDTSVKANKYHQNTLILGKSSSIDTIYNFTPAYSKKYGEIHFINSISNNISIHPNNIRNKIKEYVQNGEKIVEFMRHISENYYKILNQIIDCQLTTNVYTYKLSFSGFKNLKSFIINIDPELFDNYFNQKHLSENDFEEIRNASALITDIKNNIKQSKKHNNTKKFTICGVSFEILLNDDMLEINSGKKFNNRSVSFAYTIAKCLGKEKHFLNQLLKLKLETC